MIFRLADRLDIGAHADVFAPGDGRIYKLFRIGRTDRDSRESRAAFAAEVQAYQIAGGTPGLADHIPAFFGTCEVEAVLGPTKGDLSAGYLLDCCYGMERLAGDERGAFGVSEDRLPEVYELLEALESAGISYVADSSVFGWEPGHVLKFIDIAVRDVRADFYVPPE
jgi:hypothetical protein